MAFNQAAASTSQFLQAERAHQSKTRNNVVTGSSSKDQSLAQLLKCVCSCTTFTKSDLETMMFANMDAFINNPTSVKFYRNVCDPDPNSDGQRYLHIYELCREILYNDLKVSDEKREELLELCPSYLWEQKLEAALEEPDTELEPFLNAFMTECKFRIENSKEYQRYKEVLRDKCKKLSSLTKN